MKPFRLLWWLFDWGFGWAVSAVFMGASVVQIAAARPDLHASYVPNLILFGLFAFFFGWNAGKMVGKQAAQEKQR